MCREVGEAVDQVLPADGMAPVKTVEQSSVDEWRLGKQGKQAAGIGYLVLVAISEKSLSLLVLPNPRCPISVLRVAKNRFCRIAR